MLDFIQIIPVPLIESLGTITGKYPAKDKITSSSVDLLGEESIQRLLHITDTNNPYRFDLRRGALARVAGGGIHFPRRGRSKRSVRTPLPFIISHLSFIIEYAPLRARSSLSC